MAYVLKPEVEGWEKLAEKLEQLNALIEALQKTIDEIQEMEMPVEFKVSEG